MFSILELGKKARAVKTILANSSTGQRNNALAAIADALCADTGKILAANKLDIADAEKNGISKAMTDRLRLDEKRIFAIADAVRQIITLDDPIGKVTFGTTTPNGLKISKTTVPLGVIGIIFESRPNVTADAASLCLKSGNVCILRGGKEAINSNLAIAETMRNAIEQVGLPKDCILLVENTSRQSAEEMMKLNGYIDVLIPRGGAGLIASVVKNATVPVIETGSGNCHVYIDYNADIDMAVDITDNAKTSRPSVCNAAETLLVHENIANTVLPLIKNRLDKSNVELRVCEKTNKILGGNLKPATEEDYYTEFNDYILAVKVVKDVNEAIAHIAKYSTGHSEAIVTNDYKNSRLFTSVVDSAAVYVNASTRFTDGGEFGFGAEIGISTQKLHARGPMGLNELTTCKYIVLGDGQIR